MSSLFDLPQELRDQIVDYAIGVDIIPRPLYGIGWEKHELVNPGTGAQWIMRYRTWGRAPPYLSLMSCCRQLRHDVQRFLKNDPRLSENTASLVLRLIYPSATATWSSFPSPPEHIKTLDISIRITNLFESEFFATKQLNTVLRPLFEVLRLYIHRGPHFGKATTLAKPLHLQVVRITVTKIAGAEDMEQYFSDLAQRLATLYEHFERLLRLLARSGMLYGVIEKFEIRLNRHEWTHVAIMSGSRDKGDHEFLQASGFSWDGHGEQDACGAQSRTKEL